jgi:hypothetical protein
MDETIFPHECAHEGCKTIVQFDDEPWCFVHSPDSGSSVMGFSARARAEAENRYQKEVINKGDT